MALRGACAARVLHLGRQLVSYETAVGACSDFGGLLEVLGGDRLLNAPNETNAILRGTPKGPKLVRETYPPFHDCGC